MTPSTWWNSAKCVASTLSFLNTRSMEKYRAAGGRPSGPFTPASLWSMLALTAVVCVRSTSRRDSSPDQGYRYPIEPYLPSWCTACVFSQYAS